MLGLWKEMVANRRRQAALKREQLRAAERFVTTWCRMGAATLCNDYAETMSCFEVDAFVDLIGLFGKFDMAEAMIEAHATVDDECEDLHHQGCANCLESVAA